MSRTASDTGEAGTLASTTFRPVRMSATKTVLPTALMPHASPWVENWARLTIAAGLVTSTTARPSVDAATYAVLPTTCSPWGYSSGSEETNVGERGSLMLTETRPFISSVTNTRWPLTTTPTGYEYSPAVACRLQP